MWRLTSPIDFYANSGIILGSEVSMLNEVRASGGAIVGFGILIILGAFIDKLTYTATLVVIVLFLSYGVARLFGIAVDGYPGEEIIQGTIFEFVFGLIGVFALYKYREK
jgi:hypothetical protein